LLRQLAAEEAEKADNLPAPPCAITPRAWARTTTAIIPPIASIAVETGRFL
jgi:hypothetical protein